ncbi:MAG: restriction endonuclease subunit S [Nitrospirota bacterium]
MAAEKRIREVAIVNMGQSPEGETYNREGEGLPLLNGPTEFGPTYPRCTLFTTNSKKECLEGDLLFCVRGSTTGRMNWADQRYSLGRGVCAIRGDTILLTKYIRYCLEANLPALLNLAGGGTFPNLRKDDIEGFSIPIHRNYERIAAILSTYDDLIENNLRRIKILEEMAQNLYREWFAKFRFPGHQKVKMVDSPLGKIPEGWEVSELSSLCTLIKEPYREELHTSLPLIDLARIPQKTLLPSGVGSPKELSTSRIIFTSDDVLFGAIRPYLHKVVLAPTNGVTNVSVFVFRSRDEILKPFLAVLLSMEDTVRWADQYSTGTKMPVIKWDVFQQMKVLIPKREVIRRFYDVVWPMMQLVKNTFVRNSNLRRTRDLLLPKLISGELDVSELEITTPEANA